MMNLLRSLLGAARSFVRTQRHLATENLVSIDCFVVPTATFRVLFGFLGFKFRLGRSRAGKPMPLQEPQIKKRTALLRELKEVFRRSRSQPVQGVIATINPVLQGWVNYFAWGNASRCFRYVRLWVEHRIRRQLARACKRQGFGWKRWSTPWLYDTLGLLGEYQLKYKRCESGPSTIGLITPAAK